MGGDSDMVFLWWDGRNFCWFWVWGRFWYIFCFCVGFDEGLLIFLMCRENENLLIDFKVWLEVIRSVGLLYEDEKLRDCGIVIKVNVKV